MSSSRRKHMDMSLHICSRFFAKCETQDSEIIQSFYDKHSTSINKHKAHVFEYLCKKNYLETVRWYFYLHSDWEVSAYQTTFVDAFTLACEKGHLDMAQWLYFCCNSYMPLISKDNAMLKAHKNDHHDIVEWLVLNNQQRYFITFKDTDQEGIETVSLYINYSLPKKMDKCDILPCSICDETSEIITFCKHQFCTKCIHQWLETNETCPLCRCLNPLISYFTIVPW